MTDIKNVLKLTAAEASALTYEQARELLDTVVEALEDSTLPLADLMKLWEVGEQIAKVCETQLDAAAKQIKDSGEK